MLSIDISYSPHKPPVFFLPPSQNILSVQRKKGKIEARFGQIRSIMPWYKLKAIPVAIGSFKRDENVWISNIEPILVISEDICALWAHWWGPSTVKQNLS
jgi:hypothetical protein